MTDDGMGHRRVRGGGVDLHVATLGTGAPVILLHGFPENWRSWRHQMPALAAAGFAAWAPDLRGYNLSEGATPAMRARSTTDTLVIWGVRDPALGPELLEGLERHAPRLTIHRIATAGHWVQNEAPGEVNRVLLDFLARPDAAR